MLRRFLARRAPNKEKVEPFWRQIRKLIGNEPEDSSLFGTSVAISGNYIVVGSPYQDNNGIDQGAAYVFKIDGTSVTQFGNKLTGSEPEDGSWFGTSVAISGKYIVAGSPRQVNNGINQGAAYVFKIGGTSVTQVGDKLTGSEPENASRFGTSVAISGNYIVVGSPHQDNDGTIPDDSGDDQGAAFVFNIVNDTTVKLFGDKLTGSEPENASRFGTSVAISGNYIVVGSPYQDNNGINQGAAYVFKYY
jgi:predicted amidohydrolase